MVTIPINLKAEIKIEKDEENIDMKNHFPPAIPCGRPASKVSFSNVIIL
jgi:hypothetical protein